MNYLIPILVKDKIDFTIESNIDFINITQKQKFNLTKTLISLWVFIHNEQINDKDTYTLKGFTNIDSKLLGNFHIKINKTKIGYVKLLELLSNVNLISTNEKYSSGFFSKGYRIETEFLNENYTEVEIDFDKIFYNFKDKNYWLKKYRNYSKQIKESYEAKIDLADYINWLRKNEGINLKPVIKNGIVHERTLTKERIYEYIITALKINFNNLWFKVSDEGRFYNSLTSLSYTALPFIKLKRRSIVEIDIKNCQPLLLCSLIDSKEYQKDVEEGNFYEKMANEIGKTREEFKLLSYKYIFFSNNKLNSGKIYEALNKLYPGFIQQVNELRNKIEIAKELQKIESSIMVDIISNLDFKMMLRHDAVFVYEEDYELIKQYVKTEFNKKGLNVTIK